MIIKGRIVGLGLGCGRRRVLGFGGLKAWGLGFGGFELKREECRI